METSDSKIKEILKKYGLEEKQREILGIILKETNLELKKKLSEELPGPKLIKIIINIYQKKIPLGDLTSVIKNSFSIPIEVSEKMAEDVIGALKIYEKEKKEIREEAEKEGVIEERIKNLEKQQINDALPKQSEIIPEKNIISEKSFLEKPIKTPMPKKETPAQNLESFKKDSYREIPSEEELKPKF